MGESLSPSLQDVEALVLALYEPSSFHNVGHIQEQLHRLQKSSAGWRIARDLLGHTDDKIKFFGALTIMVKLNTESASLSNIDASELLQNMIRWLHASLTDGSGTMVVRKLTSALVAFFIHFPNLWPDCIRSLCVSMSSSSPWPVELTAVPPEMSTILWDVDSRKLQTVLWFAGTLVEEAGKIDANASKHLGIYEAIASNISDVVALMSHCFSAGCSQTSEGRSLQGDCIKTLQSWILFSQRLAARGDETIPSLRSLIPPVLSALSITDLFEAAAELLSDTLMNYSGFLLEAHYEALFSLLLEESARGRYQRLVDGDFDFESVQFGQLMLALGDSKVQLLIENTGDRSQDFLTRLRGLLHAEGYPISDDRIFVPALEFWSTFVETLVDCMCSDDHQAQPWVSAASSHVVEVVSGIWRKVIFPPAQDFADSLGKSPGGGLDLIRSNLFSWVTRLLQQLPEPDSDIELAQSAIEFVTRLTIKCPAVFLDPGLSGSAEFFYLFALQVLDGREPLPKAAAAEFWASFFSLRNENDFVQRAAETATGQLGPLLARSLIKNIGGGGARSELDKLSEPLKKMISQHSKSRSWLGDALRDEHCVGYQVTQQDREAFLKKVISLRGSRATNQVVREFWLAARGSKFAYAS
ncbi:Importin beta-like protein like [Verticillium longisporum]|nr:Importin beta-like protein like [Verticillium longisporum]